MSVPVNDVFIASKIPPAPLAFPDPARIKEATAIIMKSKRPLIIIGKGRVVH